MAARTPHFIAYAVSEGTTRARWREVGVAFWNQNESALTVLFDAVPLTGRLVLKKPRPAVSATAAQDEER